jgi:hypothetical protein
MRAYQAILQLVLGSYVSLGLLCVADVRIMWFHYAQIAVVVGTQPGTEVSGHVQFLDSSALMCMELARNSG